jgi:CubicO group peptidase (beta-lactamase class C family)
MLKAKKTVIGFLVLFLALNNPLAEAQHGGTILTAEDVHDIEVQIEKLGVALGIPGISAGIASSDSVLWVRGFGYSDIEAEIPASPETIYPLASISKPISALLMLILQDKGFLDIDEPVYPYLRNFLLENSIPLDHYKLSNVTIRHLLSHTSDYPPGSGFRYDGDRYSVLSQVVTAVTAATWEDNLGRHIFGPAGMTSTFTFSQDPAGRKTLIAKPYFNEGEKAKPGRFLTQVNAAVGLQSSVADMLKFLQACLSGDLASGEAYETMFTPTLLRTNIPVNYGLGWFIEESQGQKVIWHNGYGLASSGLIILLPEKDLAFVLLGNSNRISSPFPIGIPGIGIYESPFARVFLRKALIGSCPEFCPEQEVRDRWRIAHITGNSEAEANAIEMHIAGQNATESLFEKYSLLAELKVKSRNHHTKDIILPAGEVLMLVAQADGGYCDFFGMYDKVWLESITDGREVWRMDVSSTTYAGGDPRNRRYCGSIHLPEGSYRIHFDNSYSPYNHFMEHWEAFPPDDYFLGVRLFTRTGVR